MKKPAVGWPSYCTGYRCCVEHQHEYYYRVLRVVSQSTAASSASCKRSWPPSNLVNGQELTMCDIVWVSPQSHSLLSVKPHFLWHALQWPWPVQKRFSSDHWRLWRSKPGSRIVGSTTKVELTTVSDCQSSLHRLVTAVDCYFCNWSACVIGWLVTTTDFVNGCISSMMSCILLHTTNAIVWLSGIAAGCQTCDQ